MKRSVIKLSFFFIFGILSLPVLSQPQLVKDIRNSSGSDGSYPGNFIIIGNEVYFTASHEVFGEQLWKSDGTKAGTERIVHLQEISYLTKINNTVYFAGKDELHGTEPWQSDGTPGGTRMVSDILPGPGGSNPHLLTAVGDTLYFVAKNSDYGIYKSDGTNEGTSLADDDKSNYSELTSYRDTLFFVASKQVWKTDGTSAGTIQITDHFNDISYLYYPKYLTVSNGLLFFSSYDSPTGQELYKSDGTASGTVIVADIGFNTSCDPKELVDIKDTLYFSADDGANGREVWLTDGTEAGTRMVKDINTESGTGSSPASLTNVNGTLYFYANDGDGRECWYSDGTEAGTKKVSEKFGMDSYIPSQPDPGSNRLFFTADSGSLGMELWISEGTSMTTKLLKDIYPGEMNSHPDDFFLFNNKIFFTARDLSGNELWETDGTENGTIQFFDFRKGINGVVSFDSDTLGGLIYFHGDDGTNGGELWVSDGTEMGTHMLKNISWKQYGSKPDNFISFKGKMFFVAEEIYHYSGTSTRSRSDELWVSDGTEEGTRMLLEIAHDGYGSRATGFTVSGDLLYFTADDIDASGNELWKTDGTASGTKVVANIAQSSLDSEPKDLTDAGGILYFTAISNTGTGGRGIYKTDGTSIGTKLLKGFTYDDRFDDPADLVSLEGKVIFSAYDKFFGQELWVTDGTEEGTLLAKDIVAGEDGSYPRDMSRLNDSTAVFSADDMVIGRELWSTRGSLPTTDTIMDINKGPLGSHPHAFTWFRDKLYFVADDGIHGNELWVSDGSPESTMLVKDLTPGTTGSYPNGFLVYHDSLFFLTKENGRNNKIWVTDGTKEGTSLYFNTTDEEITSGLKVIRNSLVFSMYSSETGNELYTIDYRDAQVISFSLPQDKTYGDSSFDISVTVSTGMPYELFTSNDTIVSISGELASIHNAGSVFILASVKGNEMYRPAHFGDTLNVGRANQMITFDSIAPAIYSEGSASFNAMSSSGLPVYFTLSDSSLVFFTQDTTVAFMFFDTLVQITAHQDGNHNYNPAPPVARTLLITKNPLNADELLEDEIRIWPNPAYEFVILQLPLQPDKYAIRFLDLGGRVVNGHSLRTNQEIVRYDLNEFGEGLYFLEISIGKRKFTKKLLIKR